VTRAATRVKSLGARARFSPPAAAKRRGEGVIGMTSKTSLLASAALCLVCALSAAGAAQAAPKHKHAAASASSNLADEVRALREQVETLQATAQAQQQTQRPAPRA
jgi:uncharacterized protein YlxW (UPF0749 family)